MCVSISTGVGVLPVDNVEKGPRLYCAAKHFRSKAHSLTGRYRSNTPGSHNVCWIFFVPDERGVDGVQLGLGWA